MKLFPIEDPVVGEQILAVQPQIERYPDAKWRQRLEYFTGRALTHTALTLEQQGRAGHLAMLGRAVSPGVVIGLEATAQPTAEGAVIEIAAGLGIVTSGEIVNINRNQRVLLDNIRVYAPATLLGLDLYLLQEAYSWLRRDGSTGLSGLSVKDYGRELEANLIDLHKRLREQHYFAPPIKQIWIDKKGIKKRPKGLSKIEDSIVQKAVSMLMGADYEQQNEDGADNGSGADAYRLGDMLGQLRKAGRALPEAMVLVLQPVAVEHFGQDPATDPCDYDPTDEAFENWQWLDGCRLALYAWNQVLGPLPVAGEWRRNRIAQAIFDHERRLTEGEYLPWLALGVPIALIGLNSALEFDFLDRNAVVRRGGEPKGTDIPITPAGNRFLWQSQFEQFNEHLVDWLMSDVTLDPSKLEASDQFRHLPPVGVLPKETMSPREHQQQFFPLSYAVRALVIPYEQLDLAIEESASLLPYDLNASDRVEVLVPVSQQHYEPKLLVVEQIDPEFELTIERFSTIRNKWLGRRLDLRNKASALYDAIKGELLLYPRDDPNAIDSLEQPEAFEQTLVDEGDGCHYYYYLKGETKPPSNWYQISFDDDNWDRGFTPIGYGCDDLETPQEDMQENGYVTVYLRHRFDLDAIEETHRYTLIVTTNGGFYAYLNNHYLTSDKVNRPSYNESAAQHANLKPPRHYELGELKGHLREGENVLAILAHEPPGDVGEETVSDNADNFCISVKLVDTEDSYGTIIQDNEQDINAADKVGEKKELRSYLEDSTTPLSDTEVSKLDELGIEEYIDFLQRKIDRADDHIDFGFLRLRTDIYRVRQMILGNEVATKLATSPVLAEIAKGDSAVATKTELLDYYEHIKQRRPVSGDGEIDVSSGASNSNMAATTSRSTLSGRDETISSGDLFLSGEFTDIGIEEKPYGTFATKYGMSAKDILAREGISELLSREDRDAVIDRVRSERRLEYGAELYKTPTKEEVLGQYPIIGKTPSFNNVTVGERLKESSADVSRMAGYATKGVLLSNLLKLKDEEYGINLKDLDVPGFIKEVDVPVSEGETTKIKVDDTKTFDEIDEDLIKQVLIGKHDPVDDDDEAAYFNAGVKALENVVATLRLIEGRVHAYRQAVSRCKSAMTQVQADLKRIDQRLKTIGDELAEARHDLSVARALKAEEQARIDALNEHRDKVLETQVPFLLFRRPRTLDPRIDQPMHYLNPDLSELPLPLCNLSEVEAPEALEAMLDLLRDAPLKWFSANNLILPKLSRLADLQITISGAKKRASSKITMHPYLKQNFQTPDKLLREIGATLVQSNQRIYVERQKTTLIDLSAFQHLGWKESMQRIPEVISLGDLIDGNHGRLAASRRAADELARIEQVVSCLYVDFSEVTPGIRLHWIERLSQYDEAVNLRNLYSLPRFGELDYIQRHTMQRLVDWLYARIVSKYKDAENLISDLIRVTLLVASHAPVNQLIAGHLPEPATVQVGSLIPVITDLRRIRVGMPLSMVSAGATVVRGRVADISGGQITAEVHTTVGPTVNLEAGTRVQIGERLGMRFSF